MDVMCLGHNRCPILGGMVLVFGERYRAGTGTRFHVAMPRLFAPLPDSHVGCSPGSQLRLQPG